MAFHQCEFLCELSIDVVEQIDVHNQCIGRAGIKRYGLDN